MPFVVDIVDEAENAAGLIRPDHRCALFCRSFIVGVLYRKVAAGCMVNYYANLNRLLVA